MRRFVPIRVTSEESLGAKRISRSARVIELGFLPKVSYSIQSHRIELCPNAGLARSRDGRADHKHQNGEGQAAV